MQLIEPFFSVNLSLPLTSFPNIVNEHECYQLSKLIYKELLGPLQTSKWTHNHITSAQSKRLKKDLLYKKSPSLNIYDANLMKSKNLVKEQVNFST